MNRLRNFIAMGLGHSHGSGKHREAMTGNSRGRQSGERGDFLYLCPGGTTGNPISIKITIPCVMVLIAAICSKGHSAATLPNTAATIRFATFNVALNRESESELAQELASGDSVKIHQIAEIIRRVRPDIILLNEFDFDPTGKNVRDFQQKFLAAENHETKPIDYPFVFSAPVNTGVDSGLDLNGDGKTGQPEDAFGFGRFPGQYGMVVLSRYPIQSDQVRTFQKFLWKDMPEADWPVDPKTGTSFYNDEIKSVFRLSSKSHWDVPIKIEDQTIHFLVSHPTPPVFDGAENRNGCRNHDEIRFWADYIAGAEYFVDDNGKSGGLPNDAYFIIAGDQNADPHDGDSRNQAARLLTEHELINHSMTPASTGGVHFAKVQGQANAKHQGDPAHDTGDFNDINVGNVRIDYCLPSKTLKLIDSGVFWPPPNQPGADAVKASDHRLVWIDVSAGSFSTQE